MNRKVVSGLSTVLLVAASIVGITSSAQAAASVDSTPTDNLNYIDINDSNGSLSTSGNIIPFGDKLYVVATDGTRALYETDGTASGTKVADNFGIDPKNLYEATGELDGVLFLNFQSGATTRDFKIFSYDGSSPATDLGVEARGGVVSANGALFAGLHKAGTNGVDYPLAISIDSGSTWSSVCTTDSTGTHTWGGIAREIKAIGDRYVLAQAQAGTDYELWVYDIENQSCDFYDVNSDVTVDSFPRTFTELGDDVYFVAFDSSQGQDIYKFDGNSVSRAIDTNFDEIVSLAVYDSKLVYSAGDTAGGTLDTGIFTYDFETSTQTEIVDISNTSGAISTYITGGIEAKGEGFATELVSFRDDLYFSFETSSGGSELWRFDGSSATELTGLTGSGGFAIKTTELSNNFNPFAVSSLGLSFRATNGTNQGIGLYAPSATVSFDSNGGTGSMSSQVVDFGDKLPINSFERTGFSFSGWSTVKDGSGINYSNQASYSESDSTLYAQWSLIPAPTPYSGPIITSVEALTKTSDNGQQKTTIQGSRLGSVSKVMIGEIATAFTSLSDDSFEIIIPEGLTPGTYDLMIESSLGNLTYLDGITIAEVTSTEPEVSAVSYGEMTAWTKKINDSQVKVYVKFPTVGEKVRISHQTGDIGSYETIYVKTTSSETMDGLRIVEGVGTYIVRTINLADINRIRVTVGDQTPVQVRYNR